MLDAATSSLIGAINSLVRAISANTAAINANTAAETDLAAAVITMMPSLTSLTNAISRLSDPTEFVVTITKIEGDKSMNTKAVKADADLQIVDNGKGVLYTLTPQKGGQNVPLPPNTPPAVISVNNPALDVEPTPGDNTGLSFTGSIAQPPQDVSGIVATFTYTFPDGVQVIAQASAIDIVPSETDPDSFVIQESAQ